jgi:acetylornithine deacetylase/succinyl-diaminopimelate desuccinylase-like protein
VTAWQSYLAEHQNHFLNELFEFLRIPSISAWPQHAGDVQRAAEWVATRLRASGIEKVEVLPTGGHPVVYGEWLHAPGKPTVLIYGHFDVQPVDPLHLWSQPPFEPVIREGRIYARGATDDKGNLLAPLLAIEALLKSEGKLPVNLKFFFEGQEEIGSPTIALFLAKERERFACDFIFSADGSQWGEEQPSLLLGLRGLIALQIDLYGANSDLHSGMHGGVIQNPIHALVRLLDSMRSPEGKILVGGFYDSVQTLSAEERAKIAALPFDETAYKAQLGLDGLALFGEPGYSPRERTWIRPTLEINGIWGGFQGEGVKTVLPNEAHAKISCRLVPHQDPDQIFSQVANHVAQHTSPGVRVTVRPLTTGSHPYLVPADYPANQIAAQVLTELYGRSPLQVRMGGSIPVCALFLKELGVYTVNFAFGLNDENLHAPDEFFRLASFERAQTGYGMLLQKLGQGA